MPRDGSHGRASTADAARTRAFFENVLALPHTVGRDGRAVFSRSPGSAGVHPDIPPASRGGSDQLPGTVYLTCDVLAETVAELLAGGATITDVGAAATGPRIVLRVHRFRGAVALRPHGEPGPDGEPRRAGVA